MNWNENIVGIIIKDEVCCSLRYLCVVCITITYDIFKIFGLVLIWVLSCAAPGFFLVATATSPAICIRYYLNETLWFGSGYFKTGCATFLSLRWSLSLYWILLWQVMLHQVPVIGKAPTYILITRISWEKEIQVSTIRKTCKCVKWTCTIQINSVNFKRHNFWTFRIR